MKNTIDPDLLNKNRFLSLSKHLQTALNDGKAFRDAMICYNRRWDGMTDESFERLNVAVRIDDKFRAYLKAAEALRDELALEYLGLVADERRTEQNNEKETQ